MSLTPNIQYSLYSIPVAYATAFYPHYVRSELLKKYAGYSKFKPRDITREMLKEKGVSEHTIDRIVKLWGAHSNGNETFPLWAVAVLAANCAGVEPHTLNLASGAFIVLRMLFNYLYVNAETERAADTRSAAFFASIGIPIYLLVKAANNLQVVSPL